MIAGLYLCHWHRGWATLTANGQCTVCTQQVVIVLNHSDGKT